MQLISVGCLSLATKMQESDSLNLASFSQDGDFKFDLKSIQRMELLILCTLDWKMGSIIPFPFLQYFIHIIFAKPPPWTTLTRILELIVAIVKDVNLMDHYPPAIAVAAVLMSLDQRWTRNKLELKINAIPCSKCIDIEDVCDCYNIMQRSEKDQPGILKLSASPELSPTSTKRMLGFQRRRGRAWVNMGLSGTTGLNLAVVVSGGERILAIRMPVGRSFWDTEKRAEDVGEYW